MTDAKGIKSLFKQIGPEDRVGLECCALAFHLAKRLKAEVGCDVCVLNAGQLRIIWQSMKKTDKEDAKKIAWLLSHFEREKLPLVDLPSEEEEKRRALVSELHSKRKARTALVNRLHSVFVRVGITNIEKKDLRTVETREHSVGLLRNDQRREAARLLEELAMLERHMDEIRMEIETDVLEDPRAKRLMTMPGVGTDVAMAILAHIGDGTRFGSGRQVSNYVGMTPRIYASGETVRIGAITRRGCAQLRGLMVQAAWAAIRTRAMNSFKSKFEELNPRIGRKKAIVAIARRLLEVAWLILVREEEYRTFDPTTQKTKLDRIRRMAQKRAKKIGLAA